ncbi:MAG: phytanoyl-CoA dioxygenase family protein [Egibacteraceae bacterium]
MDPTGQVRARGVGICGEQGCLPGLAWTEPADAQRLAEQLRQEHAGTGREVTRNPHLECGWARRAVTSARLLDVVHRLIGPAVAVENTFLIIKWPGTGFTVPVHQDGINDRIVLDPARSLAVWLAITEATSANGCLEVVPGSQVAGYLPYERAEETSTGGGGRPLATRTGGQEYGFTHVALAAGQACAMDVRLLHRSGPNRADQPRIGLNVRYVAPGGAQMRDGSNPSVFAVSGDGW